MLRVGGGCRLAKFNVGGGGRLPIGGSIPRGGGGGGGRGIEGMPMEGGGGGRGSPDDPDPELTLSELIFPPGFPNCCSRRAFALLKFF